MIDMDDVRAFQKVGLLLSFSAAGRVLGVRKSAISRSIQRLEKALHVRLLERTTRGVALTDAGRVILEQLGGVLSQMDEVVDLAASLSAHPRGRLKVSAGIGFGLEVLTELLPLLGLESLLGPGEKPPADALGLLAEREEARKAKDFDRADALRDQLAEMGWEVRDEAGGARLVRRF